MLNQTELEWRQPSPAARSQLLVPRAAGGWLAARSWGWGVAGKPGWSRRLRARCSCTSSGVRIPHLERSRRRRPGDRAGIFQWGRRLLKRRIVSLGRPLQHRDRGDSEACGGGGDPGYAPQGRAFGSPGQQRQLESPEAQLEAPKPPVQPRGERYL